MKKKYVVVLIVCLAIILMPIFYISSSAIYEDRNDFFRLLKEHNITVAGVESEINSFQLKGLINEINKKSIIDKYSIKFTEDKIIKIKPEELLELNFYSQNIDKQNQFLSKASNKKVDVSMKNGVILISYNITD